MQDTDLQNHLHRLCDDPDFRALRAKFNEFDPFKVLKVERYELRHTTTLSWLLDPQQTHGLGDTFLRSFLEEVRNAIENKRPIVARDEALAHHVAVQPELRLSGGRLHSQVTDAGVHDAGGTAARRIGELDVLVESETWAVAIEAKIDSREGQAQLLDYSRYLAERFGDRKRLYLLYLTVQPEIEVIDENPGWVGIQWGQQVARALKAALYEKYKFGPIEALVACPADERALCEFLYRYMALLEHLGDTLRGYGDTVQVLADRYCDTLAALKEGLRRREDNDSPVLPWSTSPCWARRYWEHRHVFDTLIGHMRSPEASFIAQFAGLLAAPSNMPLHRLNTDGGNRATIRFVPEQWTRWEVAKDGRRAPLQSLIFYHVTFRNAYEDIEIKLLLPRVEDHDLQVRLVEQLLAQQEARGTKSLQPQRPYLGVFLQSTGGTLKLYSDKLGCQLNAGVLVLREGADEKIRAFWQAVAEHTVLLEKILSTTQDR